LLSPYTLTASQLDNQPGYSFCCAASNTYFIYYTDVSQTCGLPAHPVYDISFTRPMFTQKGTDARISHTICTYLDKLMHEADAVFTYAPLMEDKKHLARLKLFNRWLENSRPYFKCADIVSKHVTYELVDESGDILYYNYIMLYRPHQRNTVHAIEESLENLFDAKQ
jgi:hypothetical protein